MPNACMVASMSGPPAYASSDPSCGEQYLAPRVKAPLLEVRPPRSILIYTPQMSSYGGMETHLCLLAALCAQSGHKVALVTTSNSLNHEARQELIAAGVQFRELPAGRGDASALRKFMWLLTTTARLRKTCWNLIYTNGQSGLAPVFWMAARRGSRIVHHHHTAGDELEQKSWSRVFRQALRAAPELVACSMATRAELGSVIGRSDVGFLPYLTRTIFDARSIHDKSYASNAVLNFGFVGRLVSTKGIEEICSLSQMTELQGIRWHIYGEGEDYPASLFERFPNIVYHGRYRSASEHARAFGSLDAVILLSKHSEGLPLSLIEAMAAGLPWIATDRGGTRELAMSQQNSVLVKPGAALDEVRALASDLAERIRAGVTSRVAQRRVYDEHFSPEAVGLRWLEFFDPRPATSTPSSKKAHVLLVGNYPRDGQESMQRFARVMFDGLRQHGSAAELLIPPVILGRFASSSLRGMGKWLAYIDKYLLFPFRLNQAIQRLRARSKGPMLVHICDHSNAIYTRWTSGLPVLVTCHDLLAVRGAMGEQTDCPASAMGKLLQRWIVRGLARASMIVCDSGATLRDVERIVPREAAGPCSRLVHIGQNHGYQPLAFDVIESRLSHLPLPPMPYLLHVGSNLRRKNRDGVLRIFARTASRWDGWLVFAGEPLTLELSALADSLGIGDRVRNVSKPDNAILEALYNRALALLFPSRFEGFGWPIIEAQACGCPVICSDADPLPEVAGHGGLICPIDDEEAFATAILALLDPVVRESWVERGFANAANFSTEQMIDNYLTVYAETTVAT